jgi:23S rRNA maturation mini-RNase III
MISKLRGRVGSAHVIALAALFVALGGTAFAAATIGTNDIQNGAVTAKKLHKKAVRAKKIKNQAVKAKAIAPQAVTTDKIAELAVGIGRLANNSVTAPKLGGTADSVLTRTVPANDSLSITVPCGAGDQAISGGYSTPPSGAVEVTRMRRFSDASWAFTFHNTSGTPRAVDARVTCLVGG